ncbi:MAG: CHRD domain-containing protein [Rhizomicrobium sp.]
MTLLAAVGNANAKSFALAATLSGSAAVPPQATDAFGAARFSYDSDTRELNYCVTYEGLPAAKAEIHGPADPGRNAPVVIPFPAPQSPVGGTMILSRAQGAELLAGKWYVQARGQDHAAATIRGQIERE